MTEITFPDFSSRLRSSWTAGYAIGGIFTICLVNGIANEVVRSFNEVVYQGVPNPNDFTALFLMLLIGLVIIILSVYCWASIFRQKLMINADGIIHQSAFRRVELRWDEVVRLSCSNQYFRLVYAPKRYRSAPAWLRVFIDAQPSIDLRAFSNEKAVSGSPYGPIACTIQACAPHLLEHMPPGRQGDYQPTKRKSSLPTYVYPGILAGLTCAAAGSAIFMIIEEFLLGSSVLVFCFSFGFSCIPGMIGGKLLEVYLRSRQRKGKLTRTGALISGMALAALAGSSICALVIWFMFSLEPDMAGVNYVEMEFSQYFWKQVVYFRVEIAVVLLITSICGGLAGRYIFNHLFRKHTEPSF